MNNEFLTNLRSAMSRGVSNFGNRTANATSDKLAKAMEQIKTSAPVNAPQDTQTTTTEVVEETSGPSTSLWDLSTDVIRGTYGNGKARQDALTKAGYNYHQVQDFVNKRIANQLTSDDFTREYMLQPSVSPDSPGINDKTSIGGGYSDVITAGEDISLKAGSDTISDFMSVLRKLPGMPNTGVRSKRQG